MSHRVRSRGEVDLDPPRPRNRKVLTRRMMEAQLRLANFRGGAMPQTAKDPRFRLHPRTVAALNDAGLAVSYTVRVVNGHPYPDEIVDTPEVAVTWWGRMVVDAYRKGRKRGRW